MVIADETVRLVDADSGASLGTAPLLAPMRLAANEDLTLFGLDDEGTLAAARLVTHLSVVG